MLAEAVLNHPALDLIVDAIALGFVVPQSIVVIWGYFKIRDQNRTIIDNNKLIIAASILISEEMNKKTPHQQQFERLTDPDAIRADLERGADILEARQANRLTMPREDAGSPARVWRPKNLRTKQQSFWNPPRS